jgi:hypothetical protein
MRITNCSRDQGWRIYQCQIRVDLSRSPGSGPDGGSQAERSHPEQPQQVRTDFRERPKAELEELRSGQLTLPLTRAFLEHRG